MNKFEYAAPRTEAEALELLNDHGGDTAVLAGGTDLIQLMQSHLVTPQRVVDINSVESFKGIEPSAGGVIVGALTTLEEAAENPLLADYRSLLDVVEGVRSIQVQSMGTIGGDLCHLPNCWYFRNGYGLLSIENGESLPELGDNRYHAVLGNRGPAKFVNASRFAPPCIAWQARVRVIGPEPDAEEWLPLESFYVTPKMSNHGVTVLKPGQLISHVWLPDTQGYRSGAYEVLETTGLDWPLAAAAACVNVQHGTIADARIVLGHVAPKPWIAHEAAKAIIGKSLTEEIAQMAGEIAVESATPLSHNRYKVQLARTSVKRALLRAADVLEVSV
jgi:xanthine dehydrogenase YagS FAD-binding subunit